MVNSKNSLHPIISCFTFNSDHNEIALSPNDNSIIIYNLPSVTTESNSWKKLHQLIKHDSNVSSIDWSHETNLIVSCGHDRNAYVWMFNNELSKWEPTLVILRINRAANFVRWNNNGTKFAVGSSAKMVPICRYEKTNNWWVSKMIKKHKSTVLSVAWHPNNIFLITGGCDYKCRIFSAFIEELEDFEDETTFGNMFKKQKHFGALLAEINCAKGWIESVCWSPNGMEGVFVSHDPTITFFKLSEETEGNIIIKKKELKNLPFRAVTFLDETRVVAAGHDNNPFLFERKGDNAEWEFLEKMDKEEGEKKDKKVSAFSANKAMFQKTTTKGNEFKSDDIKLKTRHQNQIVELRTIGTESNEFFSCGLDGKILYWKL